MREWESVREFGREWERLGEIGRDWEGERTRERRERSAPPDDDNICTIDVPD